MTRILYIEDDDGRRETNTEFFEHRDYEVDAAANVQKAKELFAEVQPDIVVTDYKLVEETGMEFVRWLRQQDTGKNIPVLLLSSSKIDEIKRDNSDFDILKVEHLLKTASYQMLAYKITQMLQQTRLSISPSQEGASPA